MKRKIVKNPKLKLHTKDCRKDGAHHTIKPLFKLGRTFATLKVIELGIDLDDYLYRHQCGDSGDLAENQGSPSEKGQLNASGFRSHFALPGGHEIKIITNRHKRLTCIFLDDENLPKA
jgi:hypothetical protein